MKRHNLGKCCIEGCDKKAVIKEMCALHYSRVYSGRNMHREKGDSVKYPGVSTRIYRIWQLIEQRCTDPRVNKFQYYGGKGIRNLLTPYDLQFLWDRDSANEMAQPTIDRINSNEHYTLDNCRFLEFTDNIRVRFYSPKPKKR